MSRMISSTEATVRSAEAGDPTRAAAFGAAAAVQAGRYPWSGLAARLRRIYTSLVESRALVDCR